MCVGASASVLDFSVLVSKRMSGETGICEACVCGGPVSRPVSASEASAEIFYESFLENIPFASDRHAPSSGACSAGVLYG